MKFSVVIPTRNRLDLLKCAVASVIGQNYNDWEIIISDNASSEDIEGYVKSLNEPRIKYSRSEEFLSITQSWNRCIDLSTGDYVLMIGDDDILLKNHFQIIHNLMEKFEQPDLIYTNAFLYAYPGVIPEFPQGVFQPFGSLYGMPKHETPFWLDQTCKLNILQETLKFRSIYSTNMQHAWIRRSLLEKVKRNGQFFYSPYPDIYAMSALFLEAERLLIYPKELVVIGISTKSHGCYAINKKETEAIGLLNIKNEMTEISSLKSVLLPGFIVYTYWLGAIELFKLHFPIEKYNLKLHYEIYRKEQINYISYFYFSDKEKFRSQYKALTACLTFSEKLFYVYIRSLKKLSGMIESELPDFAKKLYRRFIQMIRPSPSNQITYTSLNPPPGYLLPNEKPNRFTHILEVYDQVNPVDCSK